MLYLFFQNCSFKKDSNEKMTDLEDKPDTICGYSNHEINSHLNCLELIRKK